MTKTFLYQQPKTRKWRALIFFIALTFGCLVLLSRGTSSISRIGCCVLFAIGFLLPTDELLCLITAVLPTGNIYKLSGGNTAIPFLLLIYILKSVIRGRGSINKSQASKPLLCIIALFALTSLSTFIHDVSIIETLPFFMHLVFIVIALTVNHVNDEEMFNQLALYFIVGTLVVCVGTVVFPGVSRSLGNVSMYSRANPGFASTWDFGRSLSISIAFLMVDFIKTRRRTVIDIGLSLVFLYFLIQCGRFSMLLGLGAMLVCVPFAFGKDKPLRTRISYTVSMIVVVGIIALVVFRYVYSSMIELRGYGASENGRFGVWGTYFNYLSQNPSVYFTGIGGGAISVLAPRLGISTAHNILLEKVLEVGIIGIIILSIFFSSLYRGKSINPASNINILPLITFLGTALTQGTTGNVAFALLLAMCVAEKNTEEIEQMGS